MERKKCHWHHDIVEIKGQNTRWRACRSITQRTTPLASQCEIRNTVVQVTYDMRDTR
jgi:hypothetical protein